METEASVAAPRGEIRDELPDAGREDDGEIVVRLRGVSKHFDTKAAVDRIDLDVPRRSIFGLIGPNGAGKTTTLKMIATLIKPDEGTIELCGEDLESNVGSLRPRLGYMPDQFGLFRGLGCKEYLEFFGRIHGYHGADLERRIADVFTLTELHRVSEELTTALSTGMRQRLSLAKTLLHDPDILVLDEPASGLDPRARIEIRSLLQELGTMGKTILISSHILADLEEICTDVAIIEQGKVVWSGSLRDVQDFDRTRVEVAIRVSEKDGDRAKEVLSSLECVHDVRSSQDGRLDAQIDPGSGNGVLRALIDADIDVLLFKLEAVDLEALFLERTKGIVS